MELVNGRLWPAGLSASTRAIKEQSVPRRVHRCEALAGAGPLCRLMEETAMSWLRNRLMWGALLVSLAGALAACDEGPAENAGEVVDETADEAEDAVD